MVQFDETYYGSSFKVFGGICKETCEFSIETVQDCMIATLDEVIRRLVHDNTAFVVDGQASYKILRSRMPEICFEKHTVVYSIKNWKCIYGVTTNDIESFWSNLKAFIPTLQNEVNLERKIILFSFFHSDKQFPNVNYDRFMHMIKLGQ